MTLEIDRASLLVDVPGAATLASIERALAPHGLTLGLPNAHGETTVADWLAAGAPSAPDPLSDPADHLVAGLVATLANGRRLEVRPSPRRAVGPDLVALFVGGGERFGSIERAWLRIHVAGVRRVALPLPAIEANEPLSSAERSLLDAIARELGR